MRGLGARGARRAAAVLGMAALGALIGVLPASAAPAVPGYDVSFPQCGRALPDRAAFVIVGVDGGRVLQDNPCLAVGTQPSLLGWAYTVSDRPGLYLNTGNPGPLRSQFWPSGQVWPRRCAERYPANDSVGCAYDYGWNSARDAFERAASAADQLGSEPPRDVRASDWWLDVETANNWQSLDEGPSARAFANDAAVLRGMRDHLLARGVRRVGVYSTAEQWAAIVGDAGFPAVPVWYAGLGTQADARALCAKPSFTGGPVTLAQFSDGDLDADLSC